MGRVLLATGRIRSLSLPGKGPSGDAHGLGGGSKSLGQVHLSLRCPGPWPFLSPNLPSHTRVPQCPLPCRPKAAQCGVGGQVLSCSGSDNTHQRGPWPAETPQINAACPRQPRPISLSSCSPNHIAGDKGIVWGGICPDPGGRFSQVFPSLSLLLTANVWPLPGQTSQTLPHLSFPSLSRSQLCERAICPLCGTSTGGEEGRER